LMFSSRAIRSALQPPHMEIRDSNPTITTSCLGVSPSANYTTTTLRLFLCLTCISASKYTLAAVTQQRFSRHAKVVGRVRWGGAGDG
jgi:hypothetical protein